MEGVYRTCLHGDRDSKPFNVLDLDPEIIVHHFCPIVQCSSGEFQ